jgi:hypothetical protein
MFENIGDPDEEIYKEKKDKKYPGWMAKEILLYTECKKQRQPEANSGKNMKY